MIFDHLEEIDAALLTQMEVDFASIMRLQSYPKGHLLHKEQTICNHLYIIESGLARAFYYKDGLDITAHFAPENTSITAIDSFIQRRKSKYNLEVLDDSSIISIAHADLHVILQQKPQYEKIMRLYLEQLYMDMVQRVEDLVFYTAKERYERLIDKNPDLLQRVNLKHIASFVGVTQETLSRIRGKG